MRDEIINVTRTAQINEEIELEKGDKIIVLREDNEETIDKIHDLGIEIEITDEQLERFNSYYNSFNEIYPLEDMMFHFSTPTGKGHSNFFIYKHPGFIPTNPPGTGYNNILSRKLRQVINMTNESINIMYNNKTEDN